MESRFSVRKVKTCWRSSMIAGNPIVRTFEKFGVYDKLWKEDHYYLRGAGSQFVSQTSNWGRKLRRLFDSETEAREAAAKMNEIWNSLSRPTHVKFSDFGEVELEEMSK